MSPERPPRSPRGHAWFLTVVNGVFYVRNVVCMSPGSSVSILKTLASLEVPRLLGVSTASSKESKRTCLVRIDFNGIVYVRNEVCMSPGSSVSILKSLASLEVSHLLGVSRASSKESKRTCLVLDCS